MFRDTTMAFRRAVRALVASPGLTAVVVLTLAGAIGASTTLLGVFETLVWRPIQLPEAGQLAHVWTYYPARNLNSPNLSVQKYRLFESRQHSFSSLAAAAPNVSVVTGGDGAASRVSALWVTASYVPTLGLRLGAGRNFNADEDVEHGPAVCLLSHEFWTTRFGARDDAVGRTVEVDGQPVTVVGVLADAMPMPLADVQILRPWPLTPPYLTRAQIDGAAGFLTVTGRLRAGVTIADATAELHALFIEYAQANPGKLDAKGDNYVRLWNEEFTGPMLRPMQLLVVAVVFVLLLAAANVSHVLLARWSARRTESAVRLALGASRAQRAAPFLAESIVLCGLTALGAAGAAVLLDRLAELQLSRQLRLSVALPLDATRIVWIAGACVVLTLVVCVMPVLQAVRVDAAEGIGRVRGAAGGAGARRFRDALVAVEAMVSVLLLVGAGALLTSLRTLEAVPAGFDPHGVANVEVDLSAAGLSDPAAKVEFYTRVLEEVRRDPRVGAAAFAQGLPFSNSLGRSVYAVFGRPVPPLAERPVSYVNIVSEEYFSALQIPIRDGRVFTSADRAGVQPVCVVNESLARRLFPAERAVGERVLRGQQADQQIEIVGVVGDVKSLGLGAPVPDSLYLPLRQSTADVAFLVARAADPADLNDALFREAVARVSRSTAVSAFATLETRTRQSLSVERVTASLTSGFAVVALALAALGIYGIVSYTSTQRSAELGVRAALGATRRELTVMILVGTLRRVGIGLALGVAAAAAAGPLLRSLLFGVGGFDVRIVAASVLVLTVAALVACGWPAWRAANADPSAMMREA